MMLKVRGCGAKVDDAGSKEVLADGFSRASFVIHVEKQHASETLTVRGFTPFEEYSKQTAEDT
jgi:hypothetical protein